MNKEEQKAFYRERITFQEQKMNKFPFEKREPKVLMRVEEKNSALYGKIPEQRTIKELLDYGLIILNKPAGPR